MCTCHQTVDENELQTNSGTICQMVTFISDNVPGPFQISTNKRKETTSWYGVKTRAQILIIYVGLVSAGRGGKWT